MKDRAAFHSFIDKHKEIYSGLKSEAKGNVVVYLYIVADTLISIICSIFARAGVFKVDYYSFYFCEALFIAAAVIFGALIIWTKSEILNNVRFKYYMLAVIIVCVAVQCSTLFYHSTIMLLIPFLLAFCYRSLFFEVTIAIFTALLIVATPYIAYWSGMLDISFPLWHVSISNPELFHRIIPLVEDLITFDINEAISPNLGIFLWIVLPRVLIASAMMFIMFCGKRIQRKTYEKRIRQIQFMQDNIIEGLADVIENRDAETGGHVKRTQKMVEILISKIRNEYDYNEMYWSAVVKAAAMHDLGKIVVSDAILNKPGKLTEEEFEIIKQHPGRSVEIIEKILDKVEDKSFTDIAKNIALYHHEKYDGTGYPTGISGEVIPLEARIMAIADVFDALVSKRVYKDAYSFEKAHEIIIESMGTHFDPKLKAAFELAFPELKSYIEDVNQVAKIRMQNRRSDIDEIVRA